MRLADGSCVEETFHNPPVLEPGRERASISSSWRPTEFSFGGQRHCGRGYNGLYPGPTIEVARDERASSATCASTCATASLRATTARCPSPTTTSAPAPTARPARACMTNAHAARLRARRRRGDPPTPASAPTATATAVTSTTSTSPTCTCTGCTCVPTSRGRRLYRHDGLSAAPATTTAAPAHASVFSDDVLSHVGHAEGVQHRYDLDEDGTHTAGLSWYHPHIHGTTAIQVGGGAAGAYIVRGDLDGSLASRTRRARDGDHDAADDTRRSPTASRATSTITFDDFATLNGTPGSNAQANLVNGLERVRAPADAAGTDRALAHPRRVVSRRGADRAVPRSRRGCATLDLDAGPVALTQIGRDGIPLAKPADGRDWPFAPPYVFLSSGYRVEALLDGSKLKDGDTLCLMSARALQADEAARRPSRSAA